MKIYSIEGETKVYWHTRFTPGDPKMLTFLLRNFLTWDERSSLVGSPPFPDGVTEGETTLIPSTCLNVDADQFTHGGRTYHIERD